MDLLITYINSPFPDLKFCLRSIEKYAKGIDRVFIVGDLPKYLDKETFIHVPLKPLHDGDNKAADVWYKIEYTCKTTDISEDFIVFSDDIFLTKEVDFEKFKNRRRIHPLNFYVNYEGELEKCSGRDSNIIKKVRFYTTNWLDKHGYKTLNFDIHCPIKLNKETFLEMSKKLPYKRKNVTGDAPYVFKSCYGNYTGDPGKVEIDNKVLFEKDFPNNKRLKRGWFFSTGIFMGEKETWTQFKKLYPDASKFEQKNVQESN